MTPATPVTPVPAAEAFAPRYGVPASEASVPAVRDAAYATLRPATPKAGGFREWLKGAALVLGTIYAIGFASATLLVSSINNLRWVSTPISNTYTGTMIAEVARPYRLETDARITPMEAGQAFLALQPRNPYQGSPEFTAQQRLGKRPDAPWRHWGKLEEALFPNARPATVPGLPNAAKIIPAAAGGFSAAELNVLRQIAEAPLWREYDLVARSAGMDVVGAQFEVPFGPTASAFRMPEPSAFSGTRALAYAGVSRATWYLAQGRTDLAEQSLRSVVSFGFAMIDNALTPFEQLVGNLTVATGRDALLQLFTATKDPRGPALVAAVAERTRNPRIPTTVSDLYLRVPTLNQLIAAADDPTITRAARYQALIDLSVRSCRNPVTLATGPNAETRAAFVRARTNLARYPGEQAYLDLVENVLTRPLPPAGDRMFDDVAAGLSGLYGNPRLRSCGLIAIDGWRFR